MAKRQFRSPPQLWTARSFSDVEEFVRTVVTTILTNLLRGKANNTYQVTLAVSPATTTTLATEIGTADTEVFLTPRTATAATAVGAGVIRATCADGGLVTITHDASASADRTFGVALLG
jgi:hypothetical protein